VFRTLGAQRRRPSRRPRRAAAGASEPEPIAIARVTVVPADGFADEPQAKLWLEDVCKDEQRREDEVEAALRSVNRAIQAHRVSTADPYLHEVSRAQALQARLGYGSGDELVEGRWQAASVLPPPRGRRGRRQMLAPQEEVAGILSGRSLAYPSEDLALRARLDLEQGRPVAAALQLRAAVDALEMELQGGDRERISLPPEQIASARDLAAQALRGALADGQASAVAEVLEELERTLRRRRRRDA
jgi:hypothetical protein